LSNNHRNQFQRTRLTKHPWKPAFGLLLVIGSLLGLQLAVGTHLAAAAILIVALLIHAGGPSLLLLGDIPLLVFAQVAVAATMFAFFFRLQLVGGPIYLSQIGYVAAAVALLIGVLFLGERYALLTWLGAGIVTIGVIMTTRARQAA
jgi:drug/metabolite transporter (DMT)-like permease